MKGFLTLGNFCKRSLILFAFWLQPFLLDTTLSAKEKNNPTSSLDKIVSGSLAFWKIPGCAVSIVHGDEILLCKGYGIKQIGNHSIENSIDIHTRFPIASLTKLFTSVAVGILIDQKMLTLDTPILNFYPQLNLSDAYAKDHLTIRDCLAMRSGLPGPSTYDLLHADPNNTRQQLLEKILPLLPFPLGFRSHFAYQNLLYLLVATPFGSYEDFLQKKLLTPLEMSETLTSFSTLQSCSNKAYPHVWKNGHFEQVPFDNLDAFLPAAGLSSSAQDMAQFLDFLLHHGTYHTKTILSSSTLDQIFTSQTTATVKDFTGDPSSKKFLFPCSEFLTYGLGCFVHDFRGVKMIQVPGLTQGTNSVLALVPSLNLGIFIAANAESAPFTRALLFQLIDHFLNQRTDWNTQFLKQLKND
jgi:CubicO group peptidase (beta-lactamase class C family)